MTKRVLIIGGYGNFGSYISRTLAKEDDLQVIVAGRSEDKARKCAEQLDTEWAVLDIHEGFANKLKELQPDIVINTSGPFQDQGYGVAEACIESGCHYIDLADGREFVTGIMALNHRAREKGVAVISGASSVPCLTAAILDEYLNEFQELTEIDYGITTAQHTNTGLATTSAVLSYAGKPFKTLINGEMKYVYGWQDLHWRKYPELGWRALGNCDVPDLALFPERYPTLKTQRFYAGLEVKILHLGLWLLTWFVRGRILPSLGRMASPLLRASRLFDWLGTDNSAFHMEMKGTGKAGQPKSKTFTIIARDGHGPYIPSMPSIICAKMLACGELDKPGAYPCIGVVSLGTYLGEFSELNMAVIRE